MNMYDTSVINVTVYITKDLNEDFIRDLIKIAGSIVEKNYGIKINSHVVYSIKNKVYIEINGVSYPLDKGIPSIRDFIDLLVMTAIPYNDYNKITSKNMDLQVIV